MTKITFETLANRYRRFNPKDTPSHFTVYHKSDNSVGNRYRRWQNVSAYKAGEEIPADVKVIDMNRVYEETRYQACDWSYLFDHIHYGLIVGERILAAVEECLDILRNDNPPEDDGTKVRHINRMGGVNYLNKPTFHDWTLGDKLSKILADAFFKDLREGKLYSEDFTYVYSSYSGYSRAC